VESEAVAAEIPWNHQSLSSGQTGCLSYSPYVCR